MKFLSILALVGLVCAVNAIHVLPTHTTDSVALVEASGQKNILALQKCPGSSTWTIHGLWPSEALPQFDNKHQSCSAKFDWAVLCPIKKELATKWPSCNGDSPGFWAHEYKKHGSCTGLGELRYFKRAMALVTPNLIKACDSAPLESAKPNANPVITKTGECRKKLTI